MSAFTYAVLTQGLLAVEPERLKLSAATEFFWGGVRLSLLGYWPGMLNWLRPHDYRLAILYPSNILDVVRPEGWSDSKLEYEGWVKIVVMDTNATWRIMRVLSNNANRIELIGIPYYFALHPKASVIQFYGDSGTGGYPPRKEDVAESIQKKEAENEAAD